MYHEQYLCMFCMTLDPLPSFFILQVPVPWVAAAARHMAATHIQACFRRYSVFLYVHSSRGLHRLLVQRVFKLWRRRWRVQRDLRLALRVFRAWRKDVVTVCTRSCILFVWISNRRPLIMPPLVADKPYSRDLPPVFLAVVRLASKHLAAETKNRKLSLSSSAVANTGENEVRLSLVLPRIHHDGSCSSSLASHGSLCRCYSASGTSGPCESGNWRKKANGEWQ